MLKNTLNKIINDLNETYGYIASIGADEKELIRLNETIEEIKEIVNPQKKGIK